VIFLLIYFRFGSHIVEDFDLNWNSSRNKNETMFSNGYENCPEFGGGVIFKLDIL
jgi:hypothetical protein